MIRRAIQTASLALAVLAAPASGQLITSTASLVSPTTLGLGGLGVGFVPAAPFGPAPIGSGVTYTYTAGVNGLYYDFCGWGLPPNANWCIPSLGINQNGVVRFDFTGGPVSGAGLFMNYAPCCGSVFLRAYDAASALLASYQIDAVAPISTLIPDDGAFRGIAFGAPVIAVLEIEGTSGVSPIMSSLTFGGAVSAVPEPATLALVFTGLAVTAAVARRRRAS